MLRNDEVSLAEISALAPDFLVISPGPCTPAQAGISVAAITQFAGKIPILGICLGHQAIVEAFGGRVVRAERLMHGKTSSIYHDGSSLFSGLSDPFTATRYHSLIAERDSFPVCLKITAWTDNDEIMGLEHHTLPLWGVQFHPESILSREGKDLLTNYLNVSNLSGE